MGTPGTLTPHPEHQAERKEGYVDIVRGDSVCLNVRAEPKKSDTVRDVRRGNVIPHWKRSKKLKQRVVGTVPADNPYLKRGKTDRQQGDM